MTDDDVIAEMERRFGPGDTEQYLRLAKATRALVTMWEVYAATPDNSMIERIMEQRLDRMLDGFRTRPEHAIGMIESLVALIFHMKRGGTYEEWYESIGLSASPGGDHGTTPTETA
jgi:hypothetical protein